MRRKAFAGKKRTWQRGVMNRGEQAYADHLDTLKAAGHVIAWFYESQSLLLGPNCRLTPDFLVVTGDMEIQYHEVKANRKGKWFAEEDAKVKLKAMSDKYWMFRLFVVWPSDRERRYWKQEEIGA